MLTTRSFFINSGHDGRKHLIIKAVTDLVAVLGCQTVAEGVED